MAFTTELSGEVRLRRGKKAPDGMEDADKNEPNKTSYRIVTATRSQNPPSPYFDKVSFPF